MKVPFTNLKLQYQILKSEIDNAISEVISEASFIGGKHVTTFEKKFAELIGVSHVVSCANGTDSLEIILKAWQIGPGDEVIVPAISWISTSESVCSVGAKPIFVDVDQNGLIDISKISYAITSNKKAIIPVHLYGNSVNVQSIKEIVKNTGIKILEDCAQSHLSIFDGRTTGTIGDAGSFSFYPGKNLGAYGDAGAIVTNDSDLANLCRIFANHGQQGKHNHLINGRNSRLDGLQAAILNAKLPYLKKWTEQRIANAFKYKMFLEGCKDVVLPPITDDGSHVYHLFVIRVKDRNSLAEYLNSKGIETSIHYPNALVNLKPYSNICNTNDFPVAMKFASEILSLPMFSELTEDQIKYVSDSVIEFFS
jgi:dTDP-4-amino-4,6-dideoxygalactose transaminase